MVISILTIVLAAVVCGGPVAPTRISHTTFDTSGRLTSSEFGTGGVSALTVGGQPNQITDSFSKFVPSSFQGVLPTKAQSTERNGTGPLDHTFQYNASGDVTVAQTGPLAWEQHFDEAGNVISAKEPGHNPSTYNHDSRGLTTTETLPDTAKNAFAYDSTGARHEYQDPTAQKTIDVNDQLGRPLTRTYQDGTVETHVWEGSRLASFTDRQGRKQQYIYDAVTGRLSEIRDGSGTKLDQLEYDAAGRLTAHTTKDARVESLTFDNDGHPLTTSQTRYKDSSGFGLQTPLDQFGETHTWNAFGERTSWTMPRPAGLTAAGWTDTVTLGYDGAGNLTQISLTQIGGGDTVTPLMTAAFRNAGRPTTRSVTTSCTGLAQPCTPAAIVRNYAYDATSGQLNEMQVVANGTTVAGTHVNFQNTLQAHDLQLLGVSSGTRWNHMGYDDRGRLTGSVFGTTNPTTNPAGAQPGATAVTLTPADFLSAQLRTPLLDDTTRALAASRGVSTATIEPPSSSVVELPLAAHKTDSVTKSGVTRSILYENNGGRVSDHGRLIYTWDPRGLLQSATQKRLRTPQIRQVVCAPEKS